MGNRSRTADRIIRLSKHDMAEIVQGEEALPGQIISSQLFSRNLEAAADP